HNRNDSTMHVIHAFRQQRRPAHPAGGRSGTSRHRDVSAGNPGRPRPPPRTSLPLLPRSRLFRARGRMHQDGQRARLAVALARAWAYGYDPARAAGFAAEAFAYAEAHDDPPLLAAALDAQLLVYWGPDDLDERLSITARLEDTVAHVIDVKSRMSAHL